MDVLLPDGTVIQGVPEGTTRAELIARLKRNGYDVSKLAAPEPERTVGGYAKEALKGLVPGLVGLGETAITGAAALLPEEAEQAVRKPVEEFAAGVRETFAPAPGYEDTTVRKLSEAVGSTLPFLPLGALGAAGRAAAIGLGVSAGAGEARLRAEEEDTTEGERGVATALGTVPGAAEAFAPLRILRRFGFGDEAVAEVAGLVPALKRVAKAGGEEALQEASSQVLQNLIAKGVYKPEEAVLGGVGEAAQLGGGAGAIVGAIAELALGRRLRGVETPPERREEEAPPAEPTAVAAPVVEEEVAGEEVSRREATERRAEELRRQEARRRPLGEEDQLGLGLEGGEIAPGAVLEPPVEPRPQMFVSGEEALADAIEQRELETGEEVRPRSRAYREEAKDLGVKLDRKGEVKPNQAVFEQPEVEVSPDQMALNLPGIPMERLAPRDRVLRAMAISEDKKNIPNLKFATQLRPMELQKALGDLKNEGAIAFNKQANEWELTPAGAENVRSGPEVKPARPRRRVVVPVQPSGAKTPAAARVRKRGMAGAGAAPAQSDVGEGAGELALTKPDRISERIIFSNAGSDFVKDLYSANPVDAILTNFEDLNTVTPEEINQSREYIRYISQNALRNEFGDEVTLYRGLKGTEERSPVLSYTLDKNVAKFQAEQQGIRTGKIEEIKVPVSKVLSYSEAIGRGTFAEAEVIISNPAYRMEAIRRAQEQRVARQAINEVEGRRSRLRTQAIDAFENDQIDENVYTQVTEQLKRPVPNFGMVEKVLSGEVKPGRRGIKFQRGEVPAAPQVAPERAQVAASEAVRGWTNAPNIVIASSVDDPVIPEPLRAQIPKDAPGFYRSGTTYVIADRAKDEAAVRGTVFHESLGHYGLEQEFQGGLQDLMQGIYDTNPKMQAAAKERMEKFGLDAPTAVEEVLAERSEAGPIKESWLRGAFNQVAAYIRNFLRQRGLVSTYSDNDVSQILRQAHRRVTDLKKAPYDPFNPAVRYQRSPEAQRKGDRAFVNAIGKIPQSLPVATKETLDTAKNVASNIPTNMRRALYTLYDPHEMGRIYGKDLKSDALENLWKNANQEGTELRKMQETIMDNMTKWGKVMEKYSEAEQNRIRNLFMDTTTTKTKVQVVTAKGKVKEKEVFGVEVLDLVDPARNINWKADVDHPLYKQLSALFDRDPALKDVYKGLRLAYVDNALAVEKQLQQYLTPAQWQKILSKLNEQRVRVYLPLFRQGNFKLSYTDKAGNPVALQFETSGERSAARQEILREGVDPASIKESRVEDRVTQDIPPSSFLADIVGDMKEAGVNDDIVADVIEHYLDYLPTDSVLQRGRRRQEVTPAGYSNDVLKAYANVADSYARRIVKMEFRPKYFALQEELKAATAVAKDSGAITSDVAEDLNYYAARYIDFVQNPNLSGIGAQLGYASFQLYLGANISTAVTNVIDTPTVMLSRLLGKGNSIGSVGNALLNAGSIFFSSRKSPEMQELLQRGLDTGIIREQRLQDIAEFKNLSSRWEKLKANVDRITSWAFAKSDIFNRQVGLIAAYNLEKTKNKTEPGVFDPKAFAVAQGVVADVYGSSFPKATAPIMGSDIAKTALTFKRFGIKRINLLQAAYKEATRDLDPNDPDSKIIRDAARKEIIGYFATAFVSAGVQGMPLVGAGAALVTVLNGILGDDDEPYDADFALREAVGLFAYKGPINYLLGVDVASRTGWTGMFWREDPKRMAEVGPVTYAVEQLLGPAYSYAVGVPRAFDLIEEGNYQRAFEQLMPRAVSNVSKGFRYGTEGALTAKGVPLVEDVNAYNTFMQIFGFRPSDVAEAGDIAGATKRMESKIFQRRNAIIARAAVARMSGDIEGFQEAVQEAAEFSRKYPALGISPETVYEAVQRRVKKLATSVNGVTVNPKVARGIYEELGVTEEIE